VAAFGLELVATPRVTQADYHALVSSAPFGALRDPAPSFTLSAGGVAMQALLAAIQTAGQARAVGFAGEPVGGVEFDGAGAVVVNLSARPAAVVVPAGLRGRPYVERYTSPGTVVTGTGSLRTTTGKTGADLVLAPYSLLRIG
jgi:hypothetical protein